MIRCDGNLQVKVLFLLKLMGLARKNSLNEENARKIILQLGDKLGVKNPKDWGDISVKQITELNGGKVIRNYGNSIYWTLHSLFPGNTSTFFT